MDGWSVSSSLAFISSRRRLKSMSTNIAMSARPQETPAPEAPATREAAGARLELRLPLADQSQLAAALRIMELAYPSPLPQDAIDFLFSAVCFAAAVARLDRADERESKTTCYEQLADLKKKLNEVILQRALS
jgi:hypothetical protein